MTKRRIIAALVIQVLVLTGLNLDKMAFSQDSGSHLAGDVSEAIPANGEDLALDSVGGFALGGGEAVIEPGTSSEERFSYSAVDTEAKELVSVQRPSPKSHPAGAVVAVVESPPTPKPSGDGQSNPPPSEPASSQGGSEPSPESSPEGDGSQGPGSGETGGDQSGNDGAPESAPPPICEPVFGMSCAEVIDQLLVVDDPCVDLTGQSCSQLVDLILGLVGDPDEICQNVDPEGCTEIILDLIREDPCEPRTGRTCTQFIDELINGICPNLSCPTDIANEVIDLALALYDIVYRVACPDRPWAPDCVGDYGAIVSDLVDQLVRIACPPNGDVVNCVNEKIALIQEIVFGAVRTALDVICPNSNGDPDQCYSEMNEKLGGQISQAVILLNETVDYLVRTICAPNGDVLTCADEEILLIQGIVLGALDTAVRAICPESGGDVDWCYSQTNERLNRELNDLMLALCQSTDTVICLLNVVDKVNDVAANACDGDGLTNPTGESALANCPDRVIEEVNKLLIQACGSTNATTCAENLIDRIDDALGTVCGVIPVPNDGAVSGVPPGVGACALEATGRHRSHHRNRL